MSNVFISWSGEKSKRIAEELRLWIPSVLQFAKPYFTPNDIEKGAKWSTEISQKLSETHVGIICLTKENLDKPWILFEAGALSKDLDRSRLCSILFGMDNTDLTGPLATFQTTEFDNVDFKKMMWTVNESGGNLALSKETFDTVFNKWWPDLEDSVAQILLEDQSALQTDLRSDRDIIEEILLLNRTALRDIRLGQSSHTPKRVVEDLISGIERLIKFYEVDGTLSDPISKILTATAYIVENSNSSDEKTRNLLSQLQERFDDIIPF